MAFRLLSTRVYYKTSKYAPVGVVCLRLAVPDQASPGIQSSTVNALLSEIGARTGDRRAFVPGGETRLNVYCGLVLGLQCHAGYEVAYSRVEACGADRQYRVFIEYEDHASALYAADVALDIFNALHKSPGGLAPDAILALREQQDEYVAFATARRQDPNSGLLKEAARKLHVPFINLDLPWGVPTWPGADERSGVVQYGWGFNQGRCKGGMSLGSLSPRQLEDCSDRAFVLPRLKKAQLPVPGQDLEFINRNQVRRAQRSAGRIGYPVMIRPRVAAVPQYGLLDSGVFGPLENDEQVALVAAYLREDARADIWVESFVPGTHYRFLVLDNEVVSALRMIPPTVVGDGVRAVADLAQLRAEMAVNEDSRRIWYQHAAGDGALLCRLQLKGMNLSSIPAPGEEVALRGEGGHYNGGSGEEALADMRACFNSVVRRAVNILGLQQMAGVDMVIADLQGPAEMPNCAVTGVDPMPDLVVHSKASKANNQNIPGKYFSMLLPRGKSSRIPSVAVTGTNGKTTTSRMIAGILKESGLKVGLSCSDGSYLDDQIRVQTDEAGVLGANEVLSHTGTEAAVLETARGGMANTGIAFERVDVGVCLNIAEDHLGYHGIDTLDQMAVHKRQVIERATRAAVLNAEDPRCVAMRDHTDAKKLILFARDAGHTEVVSHLENDGCAVVVDVHDNKPTIVIKASGTVTQPVIAVADIPATGNGAVVHNVHNALAAVGIAQGLGIPVEHIARGLAKFVMAINTTPGRLNEISGFPFEVLVDAAHNPHGMRSLVSYLDQRNVTGKKILVIGVRKFFSDETIHRCTAELAGHFDLYILRNYRPSDPYGPEENRALKCLEDGLLMHGVPHQDIIVKQDVLAAVDLGIESAEKGDLLVVQVTAGGNHKWPLIDRIKDSRRRAGEDLVNARAKPLSESGSSDQDIKLLLCGDVMLGRGIDQVLPNPGDPTLHESWRKIYDAREFVTRAQQKHGSLDKDRGFAYVWGDVLPEAEDFAPDLRLINLETAITVSNSAWPRKPIHYRMNPQNIEVLNIAGIDACALANNHVMDWGAAGLEETIRTLDRAGIPYAGAGLSRSEAEAPAVLDVPGKGRVIVISMATSTSGIPTAWAADENETGINLVELRKDCIERVRQRGEAVRQPGDLLVISIHWGGNYEPIVTQGQRDFARQLIDNAGVDLVHGHSSHHVKGIELHNGKLILYGCGDLVNDYEGNERPPESESLAPDLGLMYFAQVSPESGRLTGLQMVPTTMRKLRVVRGDEEDAERLMHVLNRECIELGTVVVHDQGVLHLKTMSR